MWYNPYTLENYSTENHSTADLYYDATSVFPTTSTTLFLTQLGYALECMSFLLEYMGFVLVVFPLKCGFIIVQVCVCVSCIRNVPGQNLYCCVRVRGMCRDKIGQH